MKTRISFIEVLTSILKQGAEFNSLADTALADRFNSMLELVARETQDKGDFPIMMALTNAVPPESLVRWSQGGRWIWWAQGGVVKGKGKRRRNEEKVGRREGS